MTSRMNRRVFLQSASGAAASLLVLRQGGSASSYQANEKLNVALVGTGSRGRGYVRKIAGMNGNLVAVCDVNQKRMDALANLPPSVRKYRDFRKMFDGMDRQIDAVVVVTSDHNHAAVAAAFVSAASAPTSGTEATITQTPNRVVAENESVRVVFDATVNYVPSELAYKRGSGRNLIVDNFCLYYQYVENGALCSVNEGYPGGRISNGQYRIEKKDGAATLEFTGDTPHFHLTRRATVPAAGPAVKFAYELECKTSGSFGFSLPYAPLSPQLSKSAAYQEIIGRNGETASRIIVEAVKSPALPTGSPYTRAECRFSTTSGERIVFAHVGKSGAGHELS